MYSISWKYTCPQLFMNILRTFYEKLWNSDSYVKLSNHHGYIGKILNDSGNIYRDYKIFYTNMYFSKSI